jgi:aspartyl-tRNA(Asn)/glutamyl-tRNA(Gln) amidotransferase subunit C
MISKEEVKHIAELARIGLEENEIDKFSRDLSSILDFIKQLEEVDIENVEAVPASTRGNDRSSTRGGSHVTGLKNITREDVVNTFGNIEGIKKLFPEEKEGYDKVKSVL